VFVLAQRSRSLVAEAMRDAGMRPDEYAAYSVIFEAGRITLTELTGRLGVPLTTAADYARTMVERRHARREPHPRDRRSALLTLTPAGLRAHRRASELFALAARALTTELAPLREERVRDTLQRLAASAERALDGLRTPGRERAG
jgi:DNA-binding MarR family transcriptional regulator